MKLKRSLNFYLKIKKVLVINPVPEVGLNVPKSMARVLHLKKNKYFKNYTTDYEIYLSRNKKSSICLMN